MDKENRVVLNPDPDEVTEIGCWKNFIKTLLTLLQKDMEDTVFF